MSVTKAPQNAPDSGVAAILLSVVRRRDPANALRPLVMTLMPSRNRPTPPRTEIVVDMRPTYVTRGLECNGRRGCSTSATIRQAGRFPKLAARAFRGRSSSRLRNNRRAGAIKSSSHGARQGAFDRAFGASSLAVTRMRPTSASGERDPLRKPGYGWMRWLWGLVVAVALLWPLF